MPINWENCKVKGVKHSSRWGHSSAVMTNNELIFFGGYAESKFMNDAWVYNSQKNQWNEVKIEDKSVKPAQRSNCSFFYSQYYRGMIMFAGGSSENAKLNDLWFLGVEKDQGKGYKGIWRQLYPENCKVPWGRTYHASELYFNYLIVHGGQSYVGEVDDCWALDLNELRWTEMHYSKKQEARKFHSSSIFQSKFYIIGGYHSNNELINKIQFTDISIFKSHDAQKIEEHLFQWHTVQLSQSQNSLIARWGHISKTFQNKIFIFGGRAKVEQNDLLAFDPQKNIVEKISCFKEPEPRRKPSAWIVGSNLIINSGFNGKYLDNQWFIDLRFHFKPSLKDILPHHLINVNQKQRSDIHINTSDNKYINLNSKLINNSFQTQDDMIRVLEQLGVMNYSSASKFCEVIETGVFKMKSESESEHEMEIFSDKRISLTDDELVVNEKMLKEFNITFSQNEQLANKKKILYNLVEENVAIDMEPLRVVKVSQSQFKRIVNTITKDCLSDLKIVMSRSSHKGHHHHKQETPKQIRCCKLPLMFRSEYFRNVIQQSQKKHEIQNQAQNSTQLIIEMNLHRKQMDLFKIIILYCYYGHVILPKSFSLNDCLQLLKMSKKYSLIEMEIICFQEIKNLIMSKQFQDWVWDKINFSKQRKLFNPIQDDLINKLDCGQQFISSHQFDSFLTYCAKYSKVQIQKDHSEVNKNKWFELFQYILKIFSQLCVKKIVSDVKISKCDEALAKRRNLKANQVSKRNLKYNKENNHQQKSFENLHHHTKLSLEKHLVQSSIVIDKKSSTLSKIEQLCMDQIAKPLMKNSQKINKLKNKLTKAVKEQTIDEDIFKMIRASLQQERRQGEFRFRYMLSEIV